MQTLRLLVFFFLLQFAICSISTLSKQLARIACIGTLFLTPSPSMALTFPLQASLKNNYVLLRSCESRFDALNEVQTNPVKKLQQDNGLTDRGREQCIHAVDDMIATNDFSPTFIWTSNTYRAYQSAEIIANEIKLGNSLFSHSFVSYLCILVGQNRIVPEYSFLDARAMGTYEGGPLDKSMTELHKNDEQEGYSNPCLFTRTLTHLLIHAGVNYKPLKNTDGTPSESVSDVLVRANQLISTVESMYSGENVLVISPDSEVVSILTAALIDSDPDKALPLHANFNYNNGEYRKLSPFVLTTDKKV